VSLRRVPELLGPAALVVGAALLGLGVSTSLQTYFLDTLVKVSIVVALYVFIGNSGVLSFGHIAFVALGVWTAGVLTVPESQKNAIMPGLAAGIATFAVLEITYNVLQYEESIGPGLNAFSSVPQTTGSW